MSFLDEVYAAGTPRETKADVIGYYQKKYGFGSGKKGASIPWKNHIITDLLGSQDITRGSVGDVEYKRLYKNMTKRFDPQRLNNPEPRNAGQYRTLGEMLPPIPPDSRGHIEGTIWLRFSDDCEDREIDIELSAEDVKRLFEMTEDKMALAVRNGYMSNQPGDTDIDFESKYGICAEPDLHFELID